ncbi:LysR family transcriptional regulator [Sphingomonas sp. Root710]|uniref:LysR family transcriptional regulator n=1 Tax=Sphingomonas sp. Root710 TaxID=1736594 RepID=UPI0006FDDE78|nr:LysR family transcriptional regulator [Sphingomonas sp. Root710]KRB80662.1 LysR family transcriptional regulator [Sphingomonas sp. Root710]
MKRFALYHLETLLWISRLGTFAAAAERLNTTQPAISARVRELENQMGFPLFQRAGRNMALTVRARQLVKECEPLWASIEQTLLQNSDFSGASGTVRIGAGEIASANCLPPFLAELKQDFPRAMLDVEIDLSHSMLQKLLSADFDLVLIAGPLANPNVETARIGEVKLIWVTSPVIATRIADGAAQQLVWLLHRHSPVHGLALASLAEAGCAGVLAESAYNSCNNVRALADVLVADGGIGFLPEPMVREHLACGRLVLLKKLPDRTMDFHVAVRTQERDPLVRAIFNRAAMLRIG